MTLGEKMDRALEQADLTLQDVGDAVEIYPYKLRDMFYSDKKNNALIYLKLWLLICLTLNVDPEYFTDEEFENEKVQTLLTLKAIRVEKEMKSDTVRAWEKHIDERKKRKFKK